MKTATSNFILYHPGTGTILVANDEILAVDVSRIPLHESLEEDEHDFVYRKYGYVLDNYNLSNFFYAD